MSTEKKFEQEFLFHNPSDGTKTKLPITPEALNDPKFTVGILNELIYNNPDLSDLDSYDRTYTLNKLLRLAVPSQEGEFIPQLSVHELIQMTDKQITEQTRLKPFHLLIFRRAIQKFK